MPPQIVLPGSPDLGEKIGGPSTSAITTDLFERPLSPPTSASADDVEADLIGTSPAPSDNTPHYEGSNLSGGS